MTAWTKVKKEYLEGVTPKELAKKYKIQINELYKQIENGKWAAELREIKGNLGNLVQQRIQALTNKSLDALESIIDGGCAKDSDVVSAAKAILDISGLKSSKQEITGKDGTPLVQKVFITPDEVKETDKHIDDVIGG